MGRLMSKIKNDFINEIPLIRIYAVLYLIGIFIGVIGVILSFNELSNVPFATFLTVDSLEYGEIFFQHFCFFLLLYLLGMTIIGLPFLPFFPLYKGFSIGAILSIAIISNGFRGFFISIPAFGFQNLFSLVLGYFICVSSARLSISFFELLKGRGKHSALYREFLSHTYRFLIITPILFLMSFFQWKIVPIIINLF